MASERWVSLIWAMTKVIPALLALALSLPIADKGIKVLEPSNSLSTSPAITPAELQMGDPEAEGLDPAILNKLLDGFEGKLTSTKWAKLAKCSQDTAQRDIQALIDERILVKDAAGGRSTSYSLAE